MVLDCEQGQFRFGVYVITRVPSVVNAYEFNYSSLLKPSFNLVSVIRAFAYESNIFFPVKPVAIIGVISECVM